ncbi:MAG: FecR domain-containing protein [Oscillospiraceae bacterium]|nr:FecR domain-containing protein [Oscillospiraceae bacterium]
MKKQILLVISALLLLTGCYSEYDGVSKIPDEEDTARAAVIDEFAGEVSARHSGDWLPAFRGLALRPADGVSTGGESWSSLELSENRFIMVEENATIEIADALEAAEKQTELYLLAGKLWVNIKGTLGDDESFEVLTPNMALAVRGTFFTVALEGSDTVISVFSGTVEVRARTRDGRLLLDEQGNPVIFDLSGDTARITVENGVVKSFWQGRLTDKDVMPLYAPGTAGPGGFYTALRERVPEHVWDDANDVYNLNSLPAAVPEPAGEIQLDREAYVPGEAISATVFGITEPMERAHAFIAVYKQGAAHRDWGHYQYLQAGNNIKTLKAPAEFGGYEIRLYSMDGRYTDQTLVTSVPFTVEYSSRQGRIKLDKTDYIPNEPISAAVSDITAQMESTRAFISVYKKDAAHNEWGSFQYVRAGNASRELRAPSAFGEYEIRLYSMDGNVSENTFVTAVPFTVGYAVKQGRIALDAASYPSGGGITVTVSGISTQMERAKAYIAVYPKDADHRAFTQWKPVPEGSSTQQFTAPAPGDYELRLYSMDGYFNEEVFVMSVPFTVR